MVYFLPIVCALIGWLTNWIAIRSLFRPRYPKRILKLRLPFTPGLLVRKQGEIAEKLGEITNREFLDSARVSEYVLDRIGLAESEGLGAVLARRMLSRALDKLDLGFLVEEKIKTLDPASLEELAYQAMRRELKYIEYLGGLIGFIVGCMQLALLA
jgi:uncharacterized membrane protein YheB (UPF0754 family)